MIQTNEQSDLCRLLQFIDGCRNRDDFRITENHVLVRYQQQTVTTYFRFVFNEHGGYNPYASGNINQDIWNTFNENDTCFTDLLYQSSTKSKCLKETQLLNLQLLLKRLRCITKSKPVKITITEMSPRDMVTIYILFENGKYSYLKISGRGKISTMENRTIMLCSGKITNSCPPIYDIICPGNSEPHLKHVEVDRV